MIHFMLLHVGDNGPVTPDTVMRHWGGDPGALISIVILAVLYGVGVQRLWKKEPGRVVSRREVAAFYGGILTLLVALCSPIDALADTLFSAHMLQHVLLITVAAPLAILGAPLLPLLWSLPRGLRVGLGRGWNALGMRTGGAALARPLPAWTLHTIALWTWHLPGPYTAALSSAPIHALEHASFYLTAMLVWWTALRPVRGHGGVGASLCVLAGTLAQSGALGALLTFSGTPWYYAQSAGAGIWHLTALEDQQLAGLIMWVPASLFYLAGILAVMRRVLEPPAGSRRLSRRLPPPVGSAVAAMAIAVSISGCFSSTPDQKVAGGNPQLGRAAIEHYGCGSCHAIPGVPNAVGVVGPPLGGIADRRIIAGVVPNTPDEMVRWIVMPQSIVPGNAMPNLGVSDGQARDIAAYLYTLH